MARGERRKCKCCLKLFRPDPRNRRHQRYCSAPAALRNAAAPIPAQSREFPRIQLAREAYIHEAHDRTIAAVNRPFTELL